MSSQLLNLQHRRSIVERVGNSGLAERVDADAAAVVEDQPKGTSTETWGSPVMRFHWYRMSKPMRLYRPVKVVRKGKGFFTGALTGAVDDFQKINDRHVAKEERKQR